MINKKSDNLNNNESGAVSIVEASFVFPVMFIILFFLIFMGNAYYVKAEVDAIVQSAAINGANYCADPLLETLKTTDQLPSLSKMEIDPYRYIFGGGGEVAKTVGEKVAAAINDKSSTFFSNMRPKVTTPTSQIAKYDNYAVYSTFTVEVACRVQFPIRFLGSDTPEIMQLNSRAVVPVNDTAEFIRNTDMVIDLLSGTKFGNKVSSAFKKLNDFIENFPDILTKKGK